MKVKGILIKSKDTPNVNGYIYSDEALKSINKQINESSTILGEFGQTNTENDVQLDNTVCRVMKSEYEDGNLYVDMEILSTQASSKIPKNEDDEDDEYDLSEFTFGIRGYGSVSDSIIGEDFKLVSIDLIKKDTTI